jgi:hypothetical protein
MGLAAPRFPNYFTIVGPGATWSNGTLLPSIETTIEYAVKMMDKIQAEQIKAIEVKQDALDDLYAHFDEFHKSTVWKQECRSWFKDGKKEGRIYLWPGPVSGDPILHLWSLCVSLTGSLLIDNPLPQVHQKPTARRLQYSISIQEPFRISGEWGD